MKEEIFGELEVYSHPHKFLTVAGPKEMEQKLSRKGKKNKRYTEFKRQICFYILFRQKEAYQAFQEQQQAGPGLLHTCAPSSCSTYDERWCHILQVKQVSHIQVNFYTTRVDQLFLTQALFFLF